MDDFTLGYQLVGFFDDRAETDGRIPNALNGSIIGSFEDVIKAAHSREIDILYIALPMSAEKRIITLLDELSDCAIAVHIIPNFFID